VARAFETARLGFPLDVAALVGAAPGKGVDGPGIVAHQEYPALAIDELMDPLLRNDRRGANHDPAWPVDDIDSRGGRGDADAPDHELPPGTAPACGVERLVG
jgi:hypothetical protein